MNTLFSNALPTNYHVDDGAGEIYRYIGLTFWSPGVLVGDVYCAHCEDAIRITVG